MILRLTLSLFTCILVFSAVAQDRLLLTNGKIKKLKGTVVAYDYSDIFYQSSVAKNKMEVAIAKAEKKERELKTTAKWQRKQAKQAVRLEEKKNKQLVRLEKLRKEFETDVKHKLATLSPADFEKWKTKELDAIKSIELDKELKKQLREHSEQISADEKDIKQRRKFVKSFARSKVFSILTPDGKEEVVYNADTLGLFADGEPELEYGAEEMRLYIKGRQDGRKHSFHDVYIGAAVGLASGLAWTYFLDMFYAPTFPVGCIIVMAGMPLNVRSNSPEVIENLWHPAYKDGYERSARGRKILAFTIGATGGLAIGTTVAVFTSPLLQ